MTQKISLKETERRVMATSYADGLWDVFLGCVLLTIAFSPLLSNRLGDFWGSMIFLPFWWLVLVAIRRVRDHLVWPRLGTVVLGKARRVCLVKFNILMLVLNGFLLILGLLAAIYFGAPQGWLLAIILSLALLTGFTLTAWLLSYSRLYLYGILIGACPLVGEWLFLDQRASHHGFPITFGIASALIILIGSFIFVRFIRNTPVPELETSPTEVNHG
jgi:hypothetical protein